PAGVRQETDGEVGARTPIVKRVEAELRELLRARFETRHVVAPGRDRIRLVEPRAEGDGLPEALDVGLAEDLLRPALVRVGDAGPVHRAVDHLRARDLRECLHLRAADTLAVEV